MDLQSEILGGGAIESLAAHLGVSRDAARMGAAALLPAILGGFKRDAQAREEGPGGLVADLDELGGDALVEAVVSPGPTDPAPGNEILGGIFGSKEVSRAVAAQAGGRIGVDPAFLRRMLPLLTMLVGGHLAMQGHGEAPAAAPAESNAGGGIGGLIGGLFGFAAANPEPGAARRGGLREMLDLDGDGNALEDLLNLARPVPRP